MSTSRLSNEVTDLQAAQFYGSSCRRSAGGIEGPQVLILVWRTECLQKLDKASVPVYS